MVEKDLFTLKQRRGSPTSPDAMAASLAGRVVRSCSQEQMEEVARVLAEILRSGVGSRGAGGGGGSRSSRGSSTHRQIERYAL